MGEGKALDGTTRSQMDCLPGYESNDVRVHDSRQAGELIRRLGGEAFIEVALIPGHSEKPSASRIESVGPQAYEHKVFPRPFENGFGQFSSVPEMPSSTVQRQEEPIAQRVEHMGGQQTQSEGEPSETGQQVDAEAIANIVYRMMMRDLVIGKERRA